MIATVASQLFNVCMKQSMNHISLKIDLHIMQRDPLCQRLFGDLDNVQYPHTLLECDAISGIYQTSYSVTQTCQLCIHFGCIPNSSVLKTTTQP